jgi:predicted ribonuclease YlaK
MLKGLRDRGDVRSGVRVTTHVTAMFDVAEPRFEDLPPWLDPTVPDDRVVASALLLQASAPSKVVVLVTSDLNLQNKAAAVGLPHVEPPRP